jgi:LDH2 family malate/lactate/ureidoglycolate dehydrogenase
MRVTLTELKRVAKKALLHYGHDEEESKIILDVLLYAQLRGNNQGIVKLIGRGMPKDPQAGEIRVVKETKLSALIDGNKNTGMVVLNKATEIALEKARAHGFGIAGTFNTHTSTGAIGYYARKLAEEGLLGFVFAGSPGSVCPYGSYERIFGTNPLAVGVPSETDPIVFDMATAAIAWYGLVEAKAAGESIPPRTAYDSQGNPTTDPAKAMEGAILPFDRSYKGAGLSTIIEVLTGPLVTASFVGIGDAWGNWGNLVFAIDPGLLTDGETFKKDVSKLIEKVKSTKKLPGVGEIYVPGERGNKLTQERLTSGEIEIEDNLYMELEKVVGER